MHPRPMVIWSRMKYMVKPSDRSTRRVGLSGNLLNMLRRNAFLIMPFIASTRLLVPLFVSWRTYFLFGEKQVMK